MTLIDEIKLKRKCSRSEYWERWGRHYPDPFDSVHRAKDLGQLKTIAEDVRVKLQLLPVDALLDLGCGSGKLAELLLPWVSRIDGVDGSETMLGIARAHTRGITYHRGECTEIPFPDNSFNKVLCYSVLQYSGAPPTRIFAEIRRILRPGGRALIGDIPDKRYKRHFYFEIFKSALSQFGNPQLFFKKMRMAGDMNTDLVWFHLEELASMARGLGWKTEILRQPAHYQYGWKTHTHRFDLVLS